MHLLLSGREAPNASGTLQHLFFPAKAKNAHVATNHSNVYQT